MVPGVLVHPDYCFIAFEYPASRGLQTQLIRWRLDRHIDVLSFLHIRIVVARRFSYIDSLFIIFFFLHEDPAVEHSTELARSPQRYCQRIF